ncbi:hypothetical protein EV44_g1303 [Erysiphe necator]|uniref:Uncharacterized protein n=1 Tax=Uncinula necator TaxID=52586 RepID=A0A0B1P3B6_UNCNE|nr:hypothetical protein EV44_g1303 [Erysiphe necator]
MASIGQAQLPRIEVYSPSGSSKMSQESSRLVSRSKSKFNDPFRDKYSIKASAAQGTLSYGREIQMNETSSQPSLIGTGEAAYRNKGITSKSSSSLEIQDRLAKNLDKTEDSEIIADQGTNEELSSKIDEVTNLLPVPGILLLSSNNPTLTSISEAPNNIVPIHDTNVPLEPAFSDNGIGCPVAPEIPALAIQKSSNSKKGKKTLKQGYRMTRRAIMRKGVLQILVGRELAGPAKEIIKRSCEGPAEMENTLF